MQFLLNGPARGKSEAPCAEKSDASKFSNANLATAVQSSRRWKSHTTKFTVSKSLEIHSPYPGRKPGFGALRLVSRECSELISVLYWPCNNKGFIILWV